MSHRNACPTGAKSCRPGSWTRLRHPLVLGFALLLAGCAGDSGPLAWLGREPDVPKVPPGQYPSFSAKEIKRPPVLDPKGQQRMESELQGLAQQTRQRSDEVDKEEP